MACQTKPQLAQQAERRNIPLPAEDPNQGRARNMRWDGSLVQFRKLYVSIVSIFEPQNRLLIWVG
jgi:hypothetical protein